MIVRKWAPYAVMFLSLQMAACGTLFKVKSKPSSSSASGGEQMVTASLEMTLTGAGLDTINLLDTGATFSGAVKGCASGYTKTTAQTDTSVAVPVGDTSCLGTLGPVTITFAGSTTPVTFTIDPSFAYAAGSAYVALDPTTGKRMTLTVISQLPSPIVAGSVPAIKFDLQFLDSGTTTASAASVSAGLNVQVDAPISLQIAKAALVVNSTSSVGAGDFTFSLNCLSTVTAGAMKCDSELLSGFSTAIGKDTYVDATNTPRVLTQAECTALAATGLKAAALNLFYQFDSASPSNAGTNVDVPNGGYVIKATGPGPMCNAANTKLVVAVTGSVGGSCKYWRVAVSCP